MSMTAMRLPRRHTRQVSRNDEGVRPAIRAHVNTVADVEARLGHGVARQVERVLIEHRVEIRRPRSGARARDPRPDDQAGRNRLRAKHVEPQKRDRARPFPDRRAQLHDRARVRDHAERHQLGIESLVKSKRARAAHLQIGTAGGAAHGLPEGFGGRAIDDMDRKGERDADRDGEPGQHEAHRKGAELARDQPALGGGARLSHRRGPGRAA